MRKVKSSTARPRPGKNQAAYPSLSQGPSPASRLAKLLKEAKERGIKSITAGDFEQLMAEPSFWPENESVEEFLTWRRRSRQEKR
jgi:hypothetical protein